MMQYPQHGKNSFATEGEITKKIGSILKSRKDPYKKKLALFNFVIKLEVGELEPSEEERFNTLLRGRVYNELAKQNLKEYKKLTATAYSKIE